MPRYERISSDEEDDIWDYRSQTQKGKKIQDNVSSQRTGREKPHNDQAKPTLKSQRRVSRSQHNAKAGVTGLENIQKVQKQLKRTKTKVKVEMKTERTPNAKKAVDRTGRCPVCQMPFSLLSVIETPSWHVDQCLDVPYSSKNECLAGLDCHSEIASHYKKFRHTNLARSRRKNETNELRDKGDVDSAKTKLSFDKTSYDTRLVVPGSSAECVIVLDSSQDSSFSQRSNDNLLDDSLHSQGDEIDGEQNDHCKNLEANVHAKKDFGKFAVMKAKKSWKTEEKHCNFTRQGSVSTKKSGIEKASDKNENFLVSCSKNGKQSDKHVAESSSLVENMFLNSQVDDDLPELKSDGEMADMSAGLTRIETIDISDNSQGSVDDINDLVDDTRSLSDMIHDALNPDNATATEDSDTDATDAKNSHNIKKRSESDWKGSDECDVGNDANDDDSDDPMLRLLTQSPKKPSAVSGLRETLATTPDSDSSSDWEILKTTLTQPSFELKNMQKSQDVKGTLHKSGAQMYEEAMKTPCKDFSKAVATETDKINKPANMKKTLGEDSGKQMPGSEKTIKNQTWKNSWTVSEDKQKNPKRGFFASKMLENAHRYDKSVSDNDSLHFESKEHRNEQETKNDEPSEEDGLKEISRKAPCIRNKVISDRKASSVQKKTSDRPKSCNIPSPIKHECQPSEDEGLNIGIASCRSGLAKLKTESPLKQEIGKTEHVSKKPKIEKRPKTPVKRRLGKNVSKQEKVNKETCANKGQKSVASFFKPKGLTVEQISIHTDSESSGDCERFNKIGRLSKCCDKCTEEHNGWGDYVHKVNGLNDISSANVSQCVNSQNSRSCCNRIATCSVRSCTSAKDICDNGTGSCRCPSACSVSSSQATSCRLCMASQSSLSSDSCGRCSCDGFQSQNNCNNNNKTSGENVNQACVHSQKSSQQSQTGSKVTTCQSYSKQCPVKTGLLHNQFQICSHPNQRDISSQHSQEVGSQNRKTCNCQNTCTCHSFNNSNCSLHLDIENVCTLSQNTYANMEGGFIIEDNEADDDPHSANSISNDSSCGNCFSQKNSVNSVETSDKEIKAIVQIQKSASDILMASSRLLYSKSAKNNAALSGDPKQGNSVAKTSVNDFLMRKSGEKVQSSSKKQTEKFNQGSQGNGRGSRASTSTEASDDTREKAVKRKCPFYKKIPETCMTVDAFRYGNIPDCRIYILSHFHYDHYMGLNKHFKNPIYCSKITGNLVKKKIGVDSQYIHTLPLNTPTVLENVEITFLEANHCPGAVLILFKLKSGNVFLHTGDFRACQAMELYPQLQSLRIHTLYLDTTYCDPQYDFPPQEEVIKFTVKLALDALTSNPKTLIVCGSYSIGKERIFTAIAEELDCKICVTRDKKTILDCMEDEKLKRRVSLKWEDSCLHVVPLNKINFQGLQEHLLLNGKRYNSVLGIEPTGWSYSKKTLSLYHIKPKLNKDNIKIYGIPYSEHSSFLELKRFVQFTKPVKILPTVNNGNIHSRQKMEVIFEAWMEELQSRRTPQNRQSSITGWAK